jgi:hypothetical protein
MILEWEISGSIIADLSDERHEFSVEPQLAICAAMLQKEQSS